MYKSATRIEFENKQWSVAVFESEMNEAQVKKIVMETAYTEKALVYNILVISSTSKEMTLHVFMQHQTYYVLVLRFGGYTYLLRTSMQDATSEDFVQLKNSMEKIPISLQGKVFIQLEHAKFPLFCPYLIPQQQQADDAGDLLFAHLDEPEKTLSLNCRAKEQTAATFVKTEAPFALHVHTTASDDEFLQQVQQATEETSFVNELAKEPWLIYENTVHHFTMTMPLANFCKSRYFFYESVRQQGQEFTIMIPQCSTSVVVELQSAYASLDAAKNKYELMVSKMSKGATMAGIKAVQVLKSEQQSSKYTFACGIEFLAGEQLVLYSSIVLHNGASYACETRATVSSAQELEQILQLAALVHDKFRIQV